MFITQNTCLVSTPVQGRTVYLSNYGNYVPKYLNFTWPKHLFLWFQVFTNKKNFFMKTFNGIFKKNYLKHFLKKGFYTMYQLLRFPFNQFFPSSLFALSRQLGEIYKTLRAHWMVSQPKQYYHRIWKHTWMCSLVFRIHTCVKSITKECMKTSTFL